LPKIADNCTGLYKIVQQIQIDTGAREYESLSLWRNSRIWAVYKKD